MDCLYERNEREWRTHKHRLLVTAKERHKKSSFVVLRFFFLLRCAIHFLFLATQNGCKNGINTHFHTVFMLQSLFLPFWRLFLFICSSYLKYFRFVHFAGCRLVCCWYFLISVIFFAILRFRLYIYSFFLILWFVPSHFLARALVDTHTWQRFIFDSAICVTVCSCSVFLLIGSFAFLIK